MSLTSWFLVSSGGTRHRLPREMIFVGRDDCELMLQSRSVDKQHAVINYEAGTDEHKVKDLGSLNGTFVNDVRIQEQMYITLKLEDKLRFMCRHCGQYFFNLSVSHTNLFTVVRGELTVPEEALKHEKFTSGLQLSKKPSNGETTTPTTTSKSPAKTPTKTHKSPSGSTLRPAESRTTDGVSSSKEPSAKPVDAHKAEERIGGDVTALPRGTPLYGQPSWWGDGDADDENSFKQESKSSSKKHDSSFSDSKEARRGEKAKEEGLHASSAHDSSYFEIPTKEGHMANNGIHEIPTKDTEGTSAQTAAQGHASFTIEFDNTSPGKVTIKDHVSKFTPDHHRSRSKKSGAGSGGAGARDLSTLQAAMMASESKVADWLAQNDPTLVRSESTEDDSKSIKSDVPVHLKRLKVSSSSRWRRLPPEYGSTSEEEFGSNRNSPKHGGRSHMRPHHLVPHRSSRLSTTASPGSGVVTGPGGVGVKHRMKEQEEYIRDWTAHSEEIARISQDLAKDLAILAREIHDVAGEIDSVSSSGTAPSTTVSTAATTPGSAIDTREELVDRVFDESLNFRKIPPVISTNKAPEINGKPVELRPRAPDSLEPRALRRRTWNREEAVLDSLLLNSVSQLSTKIRHSVDKTAGKIRILFKDKDRNWDEIENKLRSESDIPLLKTSNKEISSILLELKRVEKQLQVINVMVDPDGTLDALASLGLTSPTTPTKPQTAKTTSPSATSPRSAPPAKDLLPEILPGPGGSSARVQASSASTGETARDPSAGLGLTGVGGLPFSRMRPSGEEAIAQK
ncbi:Centrosomal protein of 170 kDa [Collichthys lucidus]|uniref:Centrosomal protein of 170 kDa n=1 Tax=Collichthys lucidus TaxID=240159 RepID=A0A4U5VD85_COLLU|nr:Centrosomal protein of 170 kDa [Collichthys lucidus]